MATLAGGIDEYCHLMGGNRPIRSILIANNGIAAVKCIRSIRSWAYETFGVERALLLVAMATAEDMRASAEHIRMADQFVEVPGGSNNNNYANVQLIVEVAERTKVDAVWPGWGHASENPELPKALKRRKIAFLGPPAEAMAALGDKIGSSLIAQAVGLPTLPWSGSHVKLSADRCSEPIPDDVYQQACVHSPEEAMASCQAVGFPAMIKASWGGGGKGIRQVGNMEEVRALFRQVQGEVPGSPVFVMKVASQCRHLEVQLVADVHGQVAALHSRDCSVQRRHQKIIEEGPVSVAPPSVVRDLAEGACRLAASVGYVGAATVEYLYSMETKTYFFLELNPRLQVEHPVTEWIAGVNLPALQLCIGMGIPLWKLPEVRRLCLEEPAGGPDAWRKVADEAQPFAFHVSALKRPRGHVVAVRVTSEDPDDGFKPTSGRVQELSFRSKPDVWAYFSVKSGGGIHEFSDSQFGHMFAFGDSRAAAIGNMVLALKELHIRGEIRTNVDYTVDLLQSEEYAENRVHTGWLDSRIAMRIRAERPPWHICVLGGALHMATRLVAARTSEYINFLEKGQIPPKNISLVSFDVAMNIDGVKYRVALTRRSPSSYLLCVNHSEVEAEVHTLRDGGLLMQLDGSSHVVYAEEEVAGTRLVIGGRTCLLQNDHDPSRLVAETPCKLLRYLVPAGSHISADMAYAEVEVMKMCMPLLAPAAGRVNFHLAEGQAMRAGDLIGTLELDDPSAVKKSEPFRGSLPPLGTPTALPTKAHQRCATAVANARMVLAGYDHNVDQVVDFLLDSLRDPLLPLLQWQETVSASSGRIPNGLKAQLDTIFFEFETMYAMHAGVVEVTAKKILAALETCLEAHKDGERRALENILEPLFQLVRPYVEGKQGYMSFIVQSLFEEYLAVEEQFTTAPEADVIEGLRIAHKAEPAAVLFAVLSHQGVRRKNRLLARLMANGGVATTARHHTHLLRLSALKHHDHAEVAVQASLLLEQTKLSDIQGTIVRTLSSRDLTTTVSDDSNLSDLSRGYSGVLPLVAKKEESESPLTSVAEDSKDVRRHAEFDERIEMLVDSPMAIEEALVALFAHEDSNIQHGTVEAYIRRLYQPYLVKDSISLQVHANQSLVARWHFREEHPNPIVIPFKESISPPLEAVAERVSMGLLVVASGRAGLLAIVKEALSGGLVERTSLEVAEGNGHGEGDESTTSLDGHLGAGNIFHLALVGPGKYLEGKVKRKVVEGEELEEEEAEVEALFLKGGIGGALQQAGFRTATCLFQRGSGGGILQRCFRWVHGTKAYAEQPLLRHVEPPPLSNLFELDKLSNMGVLSYSLSRDRQWHAYSCTEPPHGLRRLFLRTIIRHSRPNAESWGDLPSLANLCPPAANGIHSSGGGALGSGSVAMTVEVLVRALERAMEELELASHDSRGRADHVHVYLVLLGALRLALPREGEHESPAATVQHVADSLRAIGREVDRRLGRHMQQRGVAVWEARLRVKVREEPLGAWRLLLANPSGFACSLEVYREAEDEKQQQGVYFSPDHPPRGALHGLPLTAPYPKLSLLDRRRLAARRSSTTFCHDFPSVFEAAVQASWERAAAVDLQLKPPKEEVGKSLLGVKELVFAEGEGGWNTPLVERSEQTPLGSSVGMAAWRMRMCTPECPDGRSIFVIANDVTHGAGAFGPREDAFFKAVTDLACTEKLPLVYLAANSGARIGLAEELRRKFRVGWTDETAPERGFSYLYLSEQEYQELKESVVAERVVISRGSGMEDEIRWVVTDIIGKEDGLGVENLSGSGAIAGAFARAYRETFTLTFVTGRTVGIGAYLARLGVRCIQRVDQPIILTGFSALNKLLGREVYTSHMQLGGPKIMAVNGVVHSIVKNDLEGLSAILTWLSYVPPVQGGPLPFMRPLDPPDRLVEYIPETSCDPRAAIEGVPAGPIDPERNGEMMDGKRWLGGIFDCGSFTEALAGWAETVVVGRARLGGIPVGVIAVQTQTQMRCIPADPGQPDTAERVVPQAGQVWFPDSAGKTAQALADFNREGLPLFVIANWRGFSGGQRDLFEGVLQAGSMIVEHLRVYEKPVFVYVPRTGELRGGAWVVVDSKINPERVEMYADETARGAVLEPEGMVEIKFRKKDLLECMHRLDPVLVDLDAKLKGVDLGTVAEKSKTRDKSGDEGEVVIFRAQKEGEAAASELKRLIEARETEVLPLYTQIAIRFAELHDTPKRMLAKGVIKRIVPWKEARSFFYRRLAFRLAQEDLVKAAMAGCGSDCSHRQAMALLSGWEAELRQRFPHLQVDGAGEAGLLVLAWAKRKGLRWSCVTRPLQDEHAVGGGGGAAKASPDVDADVDAVASELEKKLEQLHVASVARRVEALMSAGNWVEGLRHGLQSCLLKVPPEHRKQVASDLKEAIDSAIGDT